MTTANLSVFDNDTIDQYTSVGESIFGFSFPILSAAELAVSQNGSPLTYGSDWTLDPGSLGEAGGGSITLVNGSSPGDIITLWLDMPIERPSGYAGGAATLLAEDLNADAVHELRISQMLRRDIRRCLRLPPDDPLVGQTALLPPAADRLGTLVGFSPLDGRLELFTLADIGGVTTPLTQTLIGSVLFPRTARETAAGIVPANYGVQTQNAVPLRHGAAGDNNGTVGNGTNDTVSLAAARAGFGPHHMDGGGRSYRVSSVLPASPVPAGLLLFNGEVVADEMVTAQDEYSVTAWGYGALQSNTYIPEQHAASGGRFFASGNHLVAFGREALKANTTGRRNTAVGSRSLLANTTGAYNTAVGSHTMEVNTVGENNVAFGVQALQGNTTGTGNTGVGVSALGRNTTGIHNTAVGNLAVGALAASLAHTADYNTGVGYRALAFCETGGDNTAVGRDALVSLISGLGNTAVGSTALITATTSSWNTAFGYFALRVCTAGENTAMGALALQALTTGTQNVAVGRQAASAATTADESVFVGYRAGFVTTTGDQNTLIGSQSGATLTTGSGNTLLGRATDVSSAAAENQTAVGAGATCTADNQVQLGNSSVSSLRCQVALTVVSDERHKQRLGPVPGLGFVRGIDTFVARRRGAVVGQSSFASISAQNLAEAQEGAGVDLGLVDSSNPDQLCVTHERLIPVLIKAVQELAEAIDTIKGQAA